MDGAVLAGFFGVLGTLLGLFIQHLLSSHEAEKQFERQRILVSEEYSKNITQELNRDLSSRLETNLAYGEALIEAGHRIGAQFLKLSDIGAREERLEDFYKLMGLPPQASITPPTVFEDKELKELVLEHRDRCIDLKLMYVLDDAESFKHVRLGELMKSISDLAERIDMRRRFLRREGLPL